MKKRLIAIYMAALSFALPSFSAVPTWQIVPEKSSIQFTATQNNAPVTGQFKHFTGHIQFDPAQLADDQVTIIINMASVSASYGEIADTLISADWFNTKKFPQATFTTKDFVKTGNNNKAQTSLFFNIGYLKLSARPSL